MKKLFTLLFFFIAFVSHAQTVTISSSAPSNIICSGNSVTFTANTTGFTNPYYQWYLNGGAISGATNSTYTSNVLTNNDGINVKVTEGPAGSITTNGLILNLDATNPASYPGSGTTWNNLVTGNEVTEFTIQSAGTYSTDNGGVIRFGNTNSGAGASSSTGFSNLSTYTVEVWVKPAGTMGDYNPADPSFGSNYTPCFFAEKVHNSGAGNRVNMVLAYNARGLTPTAMNSYRYEAAINNGGWKKYQIPTDYSSDLNNWVQILCTFNGSTMTIYRNGVSLGTSPALGVSSLRTPSIGYWIAHRWDMNDGVYGDYSKVMMYDRALSAAEVSSNYTAFNARFVSSGVSSSTITTTVYASPSIPAITMEGDACINKTTLITPAGFSYVWYKDNVAISNTNTNTYLPTTAGDYKVQVTSGSCSTQSATTTISTCGVTADGRMQAITTPTTLVSHEGGVNFGTGVSELGTTVNATGISTTLGTVGATTAVVSGVISSTNARTTSIGVIYSTDSNFGTYSTSSTQSNVVSGAYAFSLSGLSATTNYYAKSFIENKAGRSYGPAVSFTTSSPPKAVGDLYGGGIIYYILQSGDNGYDANVQHGLIAQQTNEAHNSGITTWNVIALNGNTITVAQNDGTLVGRANSAAIIANQGAGTYLFKYVSTLSINSYTDWYVPSIRELNLFRNYVYNTTYCNSNGAFPYYWYSKANSSYKWAWGTYVSSTQSGSLYNTNYIEGNGVGTRSYSQTQSGDNFVYLAIRSF